MKLTKILHGIFILLVTLLSSPAMAIDPCNCKGYDGPGGPCYDGPGGTGKNCPSVCK